MEILRFLFTFGIIYIVFNFMWKWLVIIPTSLLLVLLKLENAIQIVRAFGIYLLSSLTALTTLVFLNDDAQRSPILFSSLGGLFLLSGLLSGVLQRSREALTKVGPNENGSYDVLFIIGAIIFYIMALFFPSLVTTSLNEWLLDKIDWIFNLPIIGWVLGIGGVLLTIGYVFQNIGILTAVIKEASEKAKAKS